MSTTMEDAIRRNFAERAAADRGGAERGAERPNAIETSYLRQRVRRVSAAPADLQQARRFQNASVDVRELLSVSPLVAIPTIRNSRSRRKGAWRFAAATATAVIGVWVAFTVIRNFI